MLLDYYQGKTVLIIGGAGLVGTALCYKLITSAQPARVYILVRGGAERLWNDWSFHLSSTQFTTLRNSPLIFPIIGDACVPDTLGLEESILTTLRESCSIILHLASKIRVLDDLPTVKSTNVDSALCVAEVATTFLSLDRFVWVSSAYANAHLHWVDPQTKITTIRENIYPSMLAPESGSIIGVDFGDEFSASKKNDPELELKELEETGTTSIYRNTMFPSPYNYLKHLTERLLITRYRGGNNGLKPRLPHLLILRPSIIGPALREPEPSFEILGSTPLSTVMSYPVYDGYSTLSKWVIPSRQNMNSNIVIDECPVDIVINRLLAHTAVGTEGPVHAVSARSSSGSGRPEETLLSFADYWAEHCSHLPYSRRPTITWVSDSILLERFKLSQLQNDDIDTQVDEDLGPWEKLYAFIGCCLLFEDKKTEEVWRCMTEEEKEVLPLMIGSRNELLWALKMRKRRSKEVVVGELKRSGHLGFLTMERNTP